MIQILSSDPPFSFNTLLSVTMPVITEENLERTGALPPHMSFLWWLWGRWTLR